MTESQMIKKQWDFSDIFSAIGVFGLLELGLSIIFSLGSFDIQSWPHLEFFYSIGSIGKNLWAEKPNNRKGWITRSILISTVGSLKMGL